MIETIAKFAGAFAALAGAGMAVYSYWKSVRLRRAEWLQKLFQQFYETKRYRTVRDVLDYRPAKELSEIHSHLRDETKGELIGQLWDYLNFFEFVAGLYKSKQITREDVKLLFEYPLQRIIDDNQIMSKLGPEGYEHLLKLLHDASFAWRLS